MFPDKADGPTLFDFNSFGADAACYQLVKEGLPLFMVMLLDTATLPPSDLQSRMK